MKIKKNFEVIFLSIAVLNGCASTTSADEPIHGQLAISLTASEIVDCSSRDMPTERCLQLQMETAYDFLVELRNIVWRIEVALEEKPATDVFPTNQPHIYTRFLAADEAGRKAIALQELLPAIRQVTEEDTSNRKSYQVVADERPVYGLLLAAALIDPMAGVVVEAATELGSLDVASDMRFEADHTKKLTAESVHPSLQDELLGVWSYLPY